VCVISSMDSISLLVQFPEPIAIVSVLLQYMHISYFSAFGSCTFFMFVL
jgi:hypothetical protein